MKKSLGKRICIIGVALISAFVLLNVVFAYLFLTPFSIFINRKQMEKIVADMTINMDITSAQSVKSYMEQIDEDKNIKSTIIDKEKNIYYTTRVTDYKESKAWPLISELFDANLSNLERGKAAYLTRDKEKNGSIQIVIIQKIFDDRYVILSRSYQSLQNATYATVIFDILAGLLVILLGLIIVYRVSRYLVLPIRNMIEIADHISNLEFDNKVEIISEDEMGQLGMTINRMSEHLESNVILLQNDIENRKSLVRNLSHEIKSPITVIMGYSDRLKAIISKDPEKALQYCEIISNESARVDMLVKEMLEFSRLDQGVDEINKEKFNVRKLFHNMHQRFHEENMGKDIQYFDNYNPEDYIYADYLLLERALYNLLNNAVSHGPAGQMEIEVSGKREQEYYEIRVYNSGSFIQENELSSIWEAFSKVDKARTRGKGYGIGLAIVREIIESHNGYYSARNVEGGVEFCIAVKIV